MNLGDSRRVRDCLIGLVEDGNQGILLGRIDLERLNQADER